MIDQPQLTARQRQILKLTAEGLSRKEIASELGVTIKTIDGIFRGSNYAKGGIYERLNLHSVALLTQWALKHGVAQWKV